MRSVFPAFRPDERRKKPVFPYFSLSGKEKTLHVLLFGLLSDRFLGLLHGFKLMIAVSFQLIFLLWGFSHSSFHPVIFLRGFTFLEHFNHSQGQRTFSFIPLFDPPKLSYHVTGRNHSFSILLMITKAFALRRQRHVLAFVATTVGKKSIRALEIFRVQKLILNATSWNESLASHDL